MPASARVLIVDDDPVTLAALPTTLSILVPNVGVSTCESALAGLGQLRTTDYRMILADLRMPEMDGLTFLRKVHEIRPNTPVVLMSGANEWGLAKRVLEEGAFAFVPKPIHRGQLAQAVRLAVQCSHMRDRVRFGRRHLTHLSEVLKRAQAGPSSSQIGQDARRRMEQGKRRGTASIVQIERVIGTVLEHLRSHNETLRVLEDHAHAEARSLLDSLGE